jgi:hypothetical protein
MYLIRNDKLNSSIKKQLKVEKTGAKNTLTLNLQILLSY